MHFSVHPARHLNLIAAVFSLCCSALHAQEPRLSGMVVDRNTQVPVTDVHISLPSGHGSTSDLRGRFAIPLAELRDSDSIVFTHVSYERISVTLSELKKQHPIELQPRIIPLQAAEIEGARKLDAPIERDIPQMISRFEAQRFEIRGYQDAGDLLRTDHSVQIEEAVNGRKTLSIRAGNADDVVVLYNGVRLNSTYDNAYDMSLVQLWDVERFEIIKGSNTSLYGAEAFSGVVNIVPKQEHDYTARFQQQIGSYDSGVWGLMLAHGMGPLNASYSVRSGGMSRAFEDIQEEKLINRSLQHSGGLRYETGRLESAAPDVLGAVVRYSAQDYENQRDGETLDDMNMLVALDYKGWLGNIDGIRAMASFTRLKQEMSLSYGDIGLRRTADDNGLQASLEKHLHFSDLELLFAYQFGKNGLALEDRKSGQFGQSISLESGTLDRWKHGVVAIGKLHGETGSAFLNSFDFDASLRQDVVLDRPKDVVSTTNDPVSSAFATHDWSATMAKFAVNLKGVEQDFLIDVFLSYGSNIKFPSLQQILSLPLLDEEGTPLGQLEPEKNQSVELGASLAREFSEPRTMSGWQISASFFQNSYRNKFREITTPGVPVSFYDNVDNAQISGLEGKASVFLFRRKVQFEFGISRYFISEQAAFPFKSESKRTASLSIDHEGYALQIFHFYEGEQVGLLRQVDGTYGVVELPAFSNLDIHASKYFSIGKARVFGSVSLRNLLDNSSVVLQGLAIRDRRYYVTVGLQY